MSGADLVLPVNDASAYDPGSGAILGFRPGTFGYWAAAHMRAERIGRGGREAPMPVEEVPARQRAIVLAYLRSETGRALESIWRLGALPSPKLVASLRAAAGAFPEHGVTAYSQAEGTVGLIGPSDDALRYVAAALEDWWRKEERQLR